MASGIPLSSLATGVDWVVTPSTFLQPGATRSTYVYLRGTTTQVSVYANQALTGSPMTQPLTTSSTGAVPGYIAAEQQIDFFDALTSIRAQAEPISLRDLEIPDVVAPLASGDSTGVTDRTNLLAAIAATPAGGYLFIPHPNHSGQSKYMVDQPIVFPAHIKPVGEALVELWASGTSGVTNTNGPGTGVTSGAGCTVRAAAFSGVVIEQQTAATDCIQVTGAAATVHMENICATFASAIADTNTGHGFNFTTTQTYSTGLDDGLMGSTLRNLVSAAHDGNHYGFVFTNPILNTAHHLRSYGGGGFLFVSNTALSSYGNMTLDHPYAFVYNTGSAHGYAMSAQSTSFPGGLGLITMVRPQAIAHNAVKTAATQCAWNESVGASVPQYNVTIGCDLENFGIPDVVAPTTQVVAPALISQTSGVDSHYLFNTRYGQGALSAGTNAVSSSAFGYQALASQTANTGCTAVGYQALTANTAAGMTAVGYKALAANTSGTQSTGIGYSALAANTTAQNNTAVGHDALLTTSTGGNNTAIGAEALKLATSTNNAAVGALALTAATTTSGTTAIGCTSLTALTTGSANTAIGKDAGYQPAGVVANATVAGSNNTFVGYQTGIGGTGDFSNCVAIGYVATVNGTGGIAIGRGTNAGAAGAIAIGYDSGGTSASTTTANAIALGTANHTTHLAGKLAIDTATTVLNGTTAGTATWAQTDVGATFKRVIVALAGYENTTATHQTITFPTAFTNTPFLDHDDSGGSTVSTTVLTLPASMSSTKTGWIVVEGF